MALELDGGSTNPSKLHLPSDRCAGFVGVFVHVFMCVCVCVCLRTFQTVKVLDRTGRTNQVGQEDRPVLRSSRGFTWWPPCAAQRDACAKRKRPMNSESKHTHTHTPHWWGTVAHGQRARLGRKLPHQSARAPTRMRRDGENTRWCGASAGYWGVRFS